MTDTYWAADDKPAAPKAAECGENSVIELVGNHIYFYNGIETDTSLKLNKMLQEQTDKLLNLARINGIGKPVLNLHINSPGGLVSASVAIMDTILRLREEINIHTIVEGQGASGATFISLVGTKRFITRNSFMLIHQLSSGVYGKYSEIVDKKENVDKIMDMMKKIYAKYSKVPETQLDKILDRDLYWDAQKCLKLGMVDEIV